MTDEPSNRDVSSSTVGECRENGVKMTEHYQMVTSFCEKGTSDVKMLTDCSVRDK